MQEERLYKWTLGQKEKESRRIIKEAIDKYGGHRVAVAWSGGKDSTTVLSLIKQEYGEIPVVVVNIDTSVKFDEIYEFRDKIVRKWHLNLIILKNEQALKTIEIAKDKEKCCYLLKTLPLRQAIERHNWAALITAVRWDEQTERRDEVYLSKRGNPTHIRVHPILHFRESDIWAYIKKYNVPYCKLYKLGYRSLGCKPCTVLPEEKEEERSGRSKEKEQIMKKLRELGYF